jgi:hypothetical protein
VSVARTVTSVLCQLALTSTLVVSALWIHICPHATADSKNDVALNGVFTVKSDGQYARTNERFHDEETVISTWTFATTCTTYQACSGHVTSDQGWTAPVSYIAPLWYVVRTIDGWEHCDDGTTAPGMQTFKFYVDQYDVPNMRGWDNTLNQSGSCGINKILDIELPLTLTAIR